MKRNSRKHPTKRNEFPCAELRRSRMLTYLDVSREAFKSQLKRAGQLGSKANGLLAGPIAKSGN